MIKACFPLDEKELEKTKKFNEELSKLQEDVFADITSDLFNTFKMKNKDYGNSFSDLVDKYGLDVFLIHAEEKLNRVESLVHNQGVGYVKEESVTDSIQDLVNYGILTLMYLRILKYKKDSPKDYLTYYKAFKDSNPFTIITDTKKPRDSLHESLVCEEEQET